VGSGGPFSEDEVTSICPFVIGVCCVEVQFTFLVILDGVVLNAASYYYHYYYYYYYYYYYCSYCAAATTATAVATTTATIYFLLCPMTEVF
jgi:hypothetical protein